MSSRHGKQIEPRYTTKELSVHKFIQSTDLTQTQSHMALPNQNLFHFLSSLLVTAMIFTPEAPWLSWRADPTQSHSDPAAPAAVAGVALQYKLLALPPFEPGAGGFGPHSFLFEIVALLQSAPLSASLFGQPLF